MWYEFGDFETLKRWASALDNIVGRYWLFTNAKNGKPVPGPLLLMLRPARGGRLDTAFIKLDISPDSMQKILDSEFVNGFREAGRLLTILDYVVREDSFEAARLTAPEE